MLVKPVEGKGDQNINRSHLEFVLDYRAQFLCDLFGELLEVGPEGLDFLKQLVQSSLRILAHSFFFLPFAFDSTRSASALGTAAIFRANSVNRSKGVAFGLAGGALAMSRGRI